MDKFEKHAVIKYLFLKGMSAKAIYDYMLATLADNALAYSVVKSWLAKFKRGRNNVEDEHHSGSLGDIGNYVTKAPKTRQVPKTFKLLMTS